MPQWIRLFLAVHYMSYDIETVPNVYACMLTKYENVELCLAISSRNFAPKINELIKFICGWKEKKGNKKQNKKARTIPFPPSSTQFIILTWTCELDMPSINWHSFKESLIDTIDNNNNNRRFCDSLRHPSIPHYSIFAYTQSVWSLRVRKYVCVCAQLLNLNHKYMRTKFQTNFEWHSKSVSMCVSLATNNEHFILFYFFSLFWQICKQFAF